MYCKQHFYETGMSCRFQRYRAQYTYSTHYFSKWEFETKMWCLGIKGQNTGTRTSTLWSFREHWLHPPTPFNPHLHSRPFVQEREYLWSMMCPIVPSVVRWITLRLTAFSTLDSKMNVRRKEREKHPHCTDVVRFYPWILSLAFKLIFSLTV